MGCLNQCLLVFFFHIPLLSHGQFHSQSLWEPLIHSDTHGHDAESRTYTLRHKTGVMVTMDGQGVTQRL